MGLGFQDRGDHPAEGQLEEEGSVLKQGVFDVRFQVGALLTFVVGQVG